MSCSVESGSESLPVLWPVQYRKLFTLPHLSFSTKCTASALQCKQTNVKYCIKLKYSASTWIRKITTPRTMAAKSDMMYFH